MLLLSETVPFRFTCPKKFSRQPAATRMTSDPIEHDVKHRDSLLSVAFPTTQWSLVLRSQKAGEFCYGSVTSTMPNSSSMAVPPKGSRCTTRSQLASIGVTVGVEVRFDHAARSGDFFGV